MKILAIDSSGMAATVAVAEERRILAEYTINHQLTHSQTLLPMMDEVRQRIGLDLNSLDAIAIAAGPGSFTGLRIGAATAKGLGLALNKPLIEVPTLEGLAENVWGTSRLVCPMMDARRSQVYTGVYRFEQKSRMTASTGSFAADELTSTPRAVCPEEKATPAGQGTCETITLETVLPQGARSVEELAAFLNEQGEAVLLLGDGTNTYRELLQKLLQVSALFAPAHMNEQRAASVAIRAFDLAEQGKYVNARDHRPEYLRVSQAEREREQKLKEQNAAQKKDGI